MSDTNECARRLVFKTNSKVELGAICVNNFWMLQARRRGDREHQIPFELEYASDEENIRLVYVEDPISECG
jgi:hypothetical protein